MTDWQTVKLGDVAYEVSERVDNPSTSGYDRFVGLEHFVSGDFRITSWGTTENLISAMKLFKAGDTLFARRNAYLKRASMADFDGICSGDAIVLRNNENMIDGFLPLILNTDHFWNYAIANAAGSMSKRVRVEDLMKYEFPLPPVDEQRRIADLLWAADDSITEYTNAIASLEKLKIAYWQEIKLKDKYPLVRLREVAEIATGSTPHRGTAEYWKDGIIPWLPTQKVNEKIIRQADEFITEKAFKECSMKLFPANSILVALYGEGKTRGSVGYLTFDSCVNQAFGAIKPTEKVDGWFLYHWLDNSYVELRGFSQGSSQKNLNAQLLGQFKIPLPDKKEQESISAMLNNFSGRINDIFAHIEILRTLKKNLLTTLITG